MTPSGLHGKHCHPKHRNGGVFRYTVARLRLSLLQSHAVRVNGGEVQAPAPCLMAYEQLRPAALSVFTVFLPFCHIEARPEGTALIPCMSPQCSLS
jgi:hypothetical protein